MFLRSPRKLPSFFIVVWLISQVRHAVLLYLKSILFILSFGGKWQVYTVSGFCTDLHAKKRHFASMNSVWTAAVMTSDSADANTLALALFIKPTFPGWILGKPDGFCVVLIFFLCQSPLKWLMVGAGTAKLSPSMSWQIWTTFIYVLWHRNYMPRLSLTASIGASL